MIIHIRTRGIPGERLTRSKMTRGSNEEEEEEEEKKDRGPKRVR